MTVAPPDTSRRAWGWYVAFQAAALVPVLLVGLTLAAQYRQQRTSATLRNAEMRAFDVADLALGPALPRGDLSDASSATVQAALAPVLRRPAVHDQVLRLKVWDRTGRVVASDAPELVGARFRLDPDVEGALAGRTHREITHLTGDENVQERDFGTAVEAYVPLRAERSPEVVGVLEIYLPYEPLAAELRHGERVLVLSLAVGLTAVVLALGLLTAAITSRLRRRTLRAMHLAGHDGLTGLLSREAFEARLDALVTAGEPGVVVLADLDDFKRVNDALGHQGGDALLRHAAQVLRQAAPAAAVARLGGDEFALLLPGLGTPEEARDVLDRLHLALTVEIELEGVPVAPVASLGAVLFPAQSDSTSGLLQCADTAMYTAKQRTTGTALYDEAHDPFDAAQLRLLADLRRAVTADQLVLHFQPQACALDARVVAVEALVRWQHPDLGLVPPGDFLPLAERTGLIVPITRWVLDNATAQLATWLAAGLDLTMSINISARDLADPGLLGTVVDTADRHGVPAYRLCLELTETAIMEDPGRAREVLAALSRAGFALSLDDFGQGYTSLGQLRDLPLDELKLDRSFVTGMQQHSADRAVVATVVQLAHSLGLRVVAEGVETAAELAALRAQGYDVAQGWHLGRPATAALLEPLLLSRAGQAHSTSVAGRS